MDLRVGAFVDSGMRLVLGVNGRQLSLMRIAVPARGFVNQPKPYVWL